jgi:hypothetical protein
MATKVKAKFTEIARGEVRIDYKGNKFLLLEKSRGTYGLGSAVQLYLLEGFDKKHLKEIGWTSSDNHSCSGMGSACITKLTNMSECKEAAVKYIDAIS